MRLCAHFGTCGGCVFQDIPAPDHRAMKRAQVTDALARHGIDVAVGDVVEVAPGTRRRASFKAKKVSEAMLIGFHAARSHAIADMHECLVLTPRLVSLVPRLREMMAALLAPGGDAELHVTDTEAGVDLSLRWQTPNDAGTLAALARWASALKVARISRHGEALVELDKPCVRFGKAEVVLPPEAFLQPTRDGEAALQCLVLEALSGAKRTADLFSGCGTFALVLAERSHVHAVEIEGAMLDALAWGARTASGLKPVTTERRNLFKLPLTGNELEPYDAVCLDPPRSGALAQVRALAGSKVKRVAYVSCCADTFARDARVLIDGGYCLAHVVPVDQFLWSPHIELAAAFGR